MAVRHMARLWLPLAYVTTYLPSYGLMSYNGSIIAFGLGYLIFVIIWQYPYGESIIAFGLGYLICAIVWLYVI